MYIFDGNLDHMGTKLRGQFKADHLITNLHYFSVMLDNEIGQRCTSKTSTELCHQASISTNRRHIS